MAIKFYQDYTKTFTVHPKSETIASSQLRFIQTKLRFIEQMMTASRIPFYRTYQQDSVGRVYDLQIGPGIRQVRVYPLPAADEDIVIPDMYPAFILTRDSESFSGPYFFQVDYPPNDPQPNDHLKVWAKNRSHTYNTLVDKTLFNSVNPHTEKEGYYNTSPVNGIGEWDWKNGGYIITWQGLKERHYLDWALDPAVVSTLSTNIYLRGETLISAPALVLGAGLQITGDNGDSDRKITAVNAICIANEGRVSWYQYDFFPTIGSPEWVELWFDDGYKPDILLCKQGAYFNSNCSQVTWVTGKISENVAAGSATCKRFVAGQSGISQVDSGSVFLRAIFTSIGETLDPVDPPVVAKFSEAGLCTNDEVPPGSAALGDGLQTTNVLTSKVLAEEEVVSGDVHIASDFNSSDVLISAEIKQDELFSIEGDLSRTDSSGTWMEALPHFYYADPFTPSPPTVSIFIESNAVYAQHTESRYDVQNDYVHKRHIRLELPNDSIDICKLDLTISNSSDEHLDDIIDPLINDTIAFVSGEGTLTQAFFDSENARIVAEQAAHPLCSPAVGGLEPWVNAVQRQRDAYVSRSISDNIRDRNYSASIVASSETMIRFFGLDLRYDQYSYAMASVSASESDTYSQSFDSSDTGTPFGPNPSPTDVDATGTYTLKIRNGLETSSLSLGQKSHKIGEIDSVNFENNPSTKIGLLVDTLLGAGISEQLRLDTETSTSNSDTLRGYAPFNTSPNETESSYFYNSIRNEDLSLLELKSMNLETAHSHSLLGMEDVSLFAGEVFLPAWEYIGNVNKGAVLTPGDEYSVLFNGITDIASDETPWVISEKWTEMRVY